jgi:DNA-binding IscR family transcriptional regulator
MTSGTCPSEAKCISRHTWSALYAEITDCVDSISLKDLVDAYGTQARVEEGYIV